MGKKKYFIIVVAIGLLSGIILILSIYSSSVYSNDHKPVGYKVVYIGRYQGLNDTKEQIKRSREFNHLHEISIENNIEKIKKNNKIKLVLETYNNYKNPDSTYSIYKKILAQKNVIGIIDNTWNIEIAGAKNLIKDAKIPLVIINAGIGDKTNYGSYSLSTTNYPRSLEEVVLFIKNGIKSDSINFITPSNHWPYEYYLKLLKRHDIYSRKNNLRS